MSLKIATTPVKPSKNKILLASITYNFNSCVKTLSNGEVCCGVRCDACAFEQCCNLVKCTCLDSQALNSISNELGYDVSDLYIWSNLSEDLLNNYGNIPGILTEATIDQQDCYDD